MNETDKIIDDLLEWALSNYKTQHERVTCYTYGRTNNKAEVPPAIIAAKKYLGQHIGHLIPHEDEE